MGNNYLYDLSFLESNLSVAYVNFTKDGIKENRIKLFDSILAISTAILKIAYKLDKEQIENYSYEYSIYLFQRLLSETFVPKIATKFPWQDYIRKNIKYIVLDNTNKDKNWIYLINDVDLYMSEKDTLAEFEDPSLPVDKLKMAKEVIRSLKVFYTANQIKRLLPIAIHLILNNFHLKTHERGIEKEVKDFIRILIAITKRIASDSNFATDSVKIKDLNTALKTAVRSTLFLASVCNEYKYPKELFLSLDLESLYRLVYIAGGKKIKIPTLKDVDSLIGAVVAMSEKVLHGKEIKDIKRGIKSRYKLICSPKLDLEKFIFNTMNIYKEDTPGRDPLFNVLIQSMNSMQDIVKLLKEKIDNNSVDLVNDYNNICNSVYNFTNLLIKLSEGQKNDTVKN